MTRSMMLVASLLLGILITTGFRPPMPAAVPVQQEAFAQQAIKRPAAFASVSVNGPYNLSMCDQGVWSASVSGATGPFTYEWYLTVPGNGYDPPVTHYVGGSNTFITYLDYWISYPDRSSISLEVKVYNAAGYVGSGYRTVYAYPCP